MAETSPNEIIGANQVRQASKLSFMHRPPTITPNYGKTYKGVLKLKTNVPRVLLHDNVTQQTILSAEISGIQSQSYKTRRQLEMSIKSFLLQKQHKDKALRKLTRVHHADDYVKFELEYYGCTSESNGGPVEGNHLKRTTLPNIHAEKELHNPLINLRRSLSTRKRKLFPPVVRVVHAIPNHHEPLSKDAADEIAVFDIETDGIDSAKLPAQNVTHGNGIPGEKLGELRETTIYPKLNMQEENSQATRKRLPILDHRFELLRRTLIPQDPPNEGFAELSPSFIKPGPVQYFRERTVSLCGLDHTSTVRMNDVGGVDQPRC